MIIVAACRNLICSVHDRFERSGKKRAVPFSKTSSTFWATRTYLKDCFLFTFCCPFDSGSRSNFRTGRLNINYCPAHSYTTSLTHGKTTELKLKKRKNKIKTPIEHASRISNTKGPTYFQFLKLNYSNLPGVFVQQEIVEELPLFTSC